MLNTQSVEVVCNQFSGEGAERKRLEYAAFGELATEIPQSSGVSDSPPPAKPRIVDVEMSSICLICGDEGDVKRLMFCVKCKACAVHSYCPDKFRTEEDGAVRWKCEDCAPDNPKCLSEQLRKSERISDAAEAKYNRMKMQKESCAPRKLKSLWFAEDKSAECLSKNDGIENRQPIVEDETVLYVEPESHKAPLSTSPNEQVLESEKYVNSESIMSKCLCCPEIDKYSHARPLCDPVWKGQLRLNIGTRFLLAAYMSSKACSKVHSAVTGLPKRLDAEMLLRCVIWPKSFAMFPPNGDSIVLYLFPQYERDEKIFDGVLHNVIEQDLALRAVINNMELLIFSSHLLPPDYRRICKKYYFWGVFKPKPREP